MRYVPDPCGPPRRARLAEGVDGWVVTRYDDVRALLADERFVRNPAEVARLREVAGLSAVHMGGTGRGTTLLHLDPPAHTRVRRVVAPSFTLRRIDAHRPVIEAMAATLVDRCAPSGRADLVCDLATPLAIGVLCHVAGLPPADAARFRPWVRAVHRIDGGSEGGRRTVEAIEAMDRYLAQRSAEAPRAGALADVVERSGRGVADAGLTDDEVIALARDLLVGGYESTANLIAGGLALLPPFRDSRRVTPSRRWTSAVCSSGRARPWSPTSRPRTGIRGGSVPATTGSLRRPAGICRSVTEHTTASAPRSRGRKRPPRSVLCSSAWTMCGSPARRTSWCGSRG
jgi:cytochrome P450